MSGIVLSASVRQNLLSLQSTASLLATTQNDLATGNKVNSALDNPTNYFTAQGLDNRASDISNLLDSISNGVQVLQAANTGITSLQSLVDNAKSIANQVLQTSVGYSTLSNVSSTALNGATADNLLGASTYSDATYTGGAATGTVTAAYTSTTFTGNTEQDNTTSPAAISGTTALSGSTGAISTAFSAGDSLVVDGQTLSFVASGASGNNQINVTDDISTLLTKIDALTGGSGSTVTGGALQIATGTTSSLTITSNNSAALAALGLGTGVNQARGGGGTSTATLTGSTLLSGTTSGAAGAISTAFAAGDSLVVDGQTLSFVASGASGANQINVTDNVTTLLSKIDGLTGTGTASSVVGGKLNIQTGTTSDLSITSNNTAALTALGLGTSVSQARTATGGLSGLTLDIAATGGGTATAITFGTGSGQVSTLNQLNTALAANNLQASISTSGVISLTTTNNAASSTIGAITGTATNTGKAFAGATAAAPVADPTSQATRASLVAQYNNVLAQIDSTAQDSSYNGINLLNGDTLKLTFDETGKSTLSVTGVTFNETGLGLSQLTSGTDFLDNNSANTVLSQLNAASTTLRSEASTLGSNLSIVQIRQDFNKNLINVLQTGSSNLTLADTNQLAADSQALSTRQSIAVSALSLANQSQQSVLQLLR